MNVLLTINGTVLLATSWTETGRLLDTLLQDTRLNRRRMQGAVRIIQQMINREL